MSDELTEPGLVVHLFVAVSGPKAHEDRRRLRRIWDRLGLELDMPALMVGGLEVRTATGDPLRQAVLRTMHDVQCLSLALTGGSWQELDALWRGCAGDAEVWALGECRLFVAYVADDPDERLSAVVRAALPEPCPYSTFTAVRGFAMWEVDVGRDDRSRRSFAVLAPSLREAELDAWLWSAGDERMPPLARYLMHAAKMRYQLRVYAEGQAFRRARQRVDEQVETLLRMLDSEDLPAARVELAERQAVAAGLIWSMTRLRELRRTVEIALHNMREGAFADDLALTEWFLLRIDDDLTYAEAARERAREIGAIADLVIGERLQRRAERTAHRWERFGILEAAVLGTLLMMLGAIQSLEYRLPIPDAMKPYVVAGLGVTAFALTAVGFVRWRKPP